MGRLRFDPNTSAVLVFANVIGTHAERQRRLRLLVDTGATYTMIPHDVAVALGYRPDRAPRRIPLMTANGTVRAPLVTLARVEALGQTASSSEALVHDLPASSRIDGLLGLSFLRGFRLTLDFMEGFIELS